jgi:hypothetical protein
MVRYIKWYAELSVEDQRREDFAKIFRERALATEGKGGKREYRLDFKSSESFKKKGDYPMTEVKTKLGH